jgi:hypothetical protein
MGEPLRAVPSPLTPEDKERLLRMDAELSSDQRETEWREWVDGSVQAGSFFR